jgi:hypothetical protein
VACNILARLTVTATNPNGPLSMGRPPEPETGLKPNQDNQSTPWDQNQTWNQLCPMMKTTNKNKTATEEKKDTSISKHTRPCLDLYNQPNTTSCWGSDSTLTPFLIGGGGGGSDSASTCGTSSSVAACGVLGHLPPAATRSSWPTVAAARIQNTRTGNPGGTRTHNLRTKKQDTRWDSNPQSQN